MFKFKWLFPFRLALILSCLLLCSNIYARKGDSKFKVIAFFTGRIEPAHVSFVHQANHWFAETSKKYRFTYDSTDNWDNLNLDFLAKYDIVIFLDTRPEKPEQRHAFEQYMKRGGAWIGFHFAAFALTPSDFPQNWDWYHNLFLGSGEYEGNTWKPTSAVLRVEDRKNRFTKHIPVTFKASPNEWYKWQNDLRKNPDIEVLVSIDPRSFPLGTGPKPNEIWHSGDYPVVWTNKNYRMLYFNMGHNDIDYDGKTNKELSDTFSSQVQNKLVINGVKLLGKKK
jgi:hypothetical protein